MKKMSIAVLALVCFSSVAGVAAEPIKANIPFAFQAGDVALPPGQYIFTMDWHSHLLIQGSDGLNACILPMVREGNSSEFRVTFSKYGDQYFLSEVANQEFRASLIKSPAEKVLAMNAAKRPVIAAVIK